MTRLYLDEIDKCESWYSTLLIFKHDSYLETKNCSCILLKGKIQRIVLDSGVDQELRQYLSRAFIHWLRSVGSLLTTRENRDRRLRVPSVAEIVEAIMVLPRPPEHRCVRDRGRTSVFAIKTIFTLTYVGFLRAEKIPVGSGLETSDPY